ncbi:Smg8/Smg9 [Trinorchestia longiramus]|nr:Smg8/Smg9 [Trinorchestia longiramus]
MKKLFEGPFKIPFKFDKESVSVGDEPVAVVSVVGQSELEDGSNKTAVLRLLLGYDISDDSRLQPVEIDDSLVLIEGWYDRSLRVVFLHLIGAQDQAFLHCDKINALYDEKDSVVATSLLEQQYSRALLFVFSVSHVVLWCFTSHVLDTTVITTLRMINNIRTGVQEAVSSLLQEVDGTHKDWVNCARLCCPRLLFLFSDGYLDTNELSDQLGPEGEPGSVDAALRTVERSLEDQIYRLLRRTWIITNNTANSVVSLPTRLQYVYIVTRNQQSLPAEDLAVDALQLHCSGAVEDNTLGDTMLRRGLHVLDNVNLLDDSGAAAGRSAAATKSKQRTLPDLLALNLLSANITDTEANNERRFSAFLQQHITATLAGGFDDNVGRGTAVPVFVLPKLRAWVSAVNLLHKVFITPEVDNTLPSTLVKTLTLESCDLQFLRNSCKDAYDKAVACYNYNAAPHYPQHLHRQMVADSVALYKSQSIECVFTGEYEAALRRDCDNLWHEGRLGCEQLSITGHICQCPRHEHPTRLDKSGKEVPDHKFGTEFSKFCNCGRRRNQVLDSAAVRALNYDFYCEMEKMCCGQLDRYSFPSVATGPKLTRVLPDFSLYPQKTQQGAPGGPRLRHSAWERTDIPEVGSSESSQDEDKKTRVRDEEVLSTDEALSDDGDPGGAHVQDSDVSDQESQDHTALSRDSRLRQHDTSRECGAGNSSMREDDDEALVLKTQDYLSNEEQDSEGNGSVGSYEPPRRSPESEPVSNLTEVLAEMGVDDGDPKDESNQNPKKTFHRINSEEIERFRSLLDEDARKSSLDHFQLDPMLCSESPEDFLPPYPSWSLVCVGASSLYSHTIGIIDQPGFVSHSNFLLPWDCVVKVTGPADWRAIEQRLGRKSKEKINHQKGEFTVKVFLGTEYECSFGNRFLMSSPKTPLYTKQAHPTISARPIATSAMPLYQPCICRESKTSGAHLGQLTRIHIVTPKAPVHVVVNPRVQPGSAPCPTYFPISADHPGIELRSGSYWVLRLPIVYVGENGPFYPPDPSKRIGIENGCLLAGYISMTGVTFGDV